MTSPPPEHSAEKDAPTVTHVHHEWTGAASDPPWCPVCGMVWSPSVTPPGGTDHE